MYPRRTANEWTFLIRSSRIGYPQIFVDRQSVIQVLYENLESPANVLTNKRVDRIEHEEEKVTVHTQDGSTYTGDFVVGADGIHSTVRKEMWKTAQEKKSNLFDCDPLQGKTSMLLNLTLTKEFADLQCESKCIFGISRRPTNMPSSPLQLNAFFENCNYMILTAPEDRLYWFLFTPADKTLGKDIPRYSKEDETALAELHFQDRLAENLTFEDIYVNRLQTTLVSIEDHVFPRWHYRRIITIGDAAHKVSKCMKLLYDRF